MFVPIFLYFFNIVAIHSFGACIDGMVELSEGSWSVIFWVWSASFVGAVPMIAIILLCTDLVRAAKASILIGLAISALGIVVAVNTSLTPWKTAHVVAAVAVYLLGLLSTCSIRPHGEVVPVPAAAEGGGALPTESIEGVEECSICLKEDGEHRAVLSCGHRFHVDCVMQWLPENPTCPVCRTVNLV